MVFTGFNVSLSSWDVDLDTGDVSQRSVVCPAPASIALQDAHEDIDPAWAGRMCEEVGTRTFVSGAAVAIASLGLGLWAIMRGKRPEVCSISKLPDFGTDRSND